MLLLLEIEFENCWEDKDEVEVGAGKKEEKEEKDEKVEKGEISLTDTGKNIGFMAERSDEKIGEAAEGKEELEVEVEYDRFPFSFPDLNLFCRWWSIYRFSLLFVNLSKEPKTSEESEIVSKAESSSSCDSSFSGNVLRIE